MFTIKRLMIGMLSLLITGLVYADTPQYVLQCSLYGCDNVVVKITTISAQHGTNIYTYQNMTPNQPIPLSFTDPTIQSVEVTSIIVDGKNLEDHGFSCYNAYGSNPYNFMQIYTTVTSHAYGCYLTH